MVMRQSIRVVPPRVSMFGVPDWFHHHGFKMHLEKFDKEQKRITLSSSAAFLVILPANIDAHERWAVEWRVVQSRNEETNGKVFFTSPELASAFGLSSESDNSGDWLIERFGAHSACQGRYIRWTGEISGQHFLNIPCPGTGHDGDPNISIEVDPRMQEAIKALLR